MKKTEWIGVSIVVILVALAGIGYNLTYQTYFCEERGIVMDCTRFSSSGLRCYPSLTSRARYRDCPNGWIQLKEETQIEQKISANKEVKKYLCDQKECVKI